MGAVSPPATMTGWSQILTGLPQTAVAFLIGIDKKKSYVAFPVLE